MKKIMLLVILGFMLGGCATKWRYPGPQDEANRIAFDCEYKAKMISKGTGSFAGLVMQSNFEHCLEMNGFTRIKE